MDGARAAYDEEPVGLLCYDSDGFAAASEDGVEGIDGLWGMSCQKMDLEVERRGKGALTAGTSDWRS